MSTENKIDAEKLNHCSVCKKLCSSKCSNCGQAFYCCIEHQKSDWKRHKINCHPFMICNDSKFGRYLIASRNIKSGEIVLKEKPLIRGPAQITSPVCVGCLDGLQENLEFECKRCGWPICSDKCSNNIEHKNECDLTIARGSKVNIKHYFSPHPSYQCVIVLRCLLLKELCPERWEKLYQLESHSEERRGSIQWRNDREGIAKFIPRFFKCDKWTEDEILKVCGIVQINAHEIPLTEPPHIAIYDYASLVEHSCIPNLTKTFSAKDELIFWAPKSINKGEHLSISYTDVLWGTMNRQHHLKQTKMFKCDCKRCTDTTEMKTYYSALKCNNKDNNCDGVALPGSIDRWDDSWKCLSCNHKMESSYVSTILERAGKDLSVMDKSKEDNCVKYIEHYIKWLPSQHYYITDVKMAYVQLIGSGGSHIIQGLNEEKLQLKIKLSRELLKLYNIIAPVEARCLGTIHFELHTGLAELGRRLLQLQDDNFKAVLEESLINAEITVRLLEKESKLVTEGQVCEQAQINVNSLKLLLGRLTNGLEI